MAEDEAREVIDNEESVRGLVRHKRTWAFPLRKWGATGVFRSQEMC